MEYAQIGWNKLYGSGIGCNGQKWVDNDIDNDNDEKTYVYNDDDDNDDNE